MEHLILGVSGKPGSFSEAAALEYCRSEKISGFALEYLVSVEKVLRELTAGKISLGIFPIENSNGGIVYEAIYAMAQYLFTIKKIFEIDVRQNLLVLPGTAARAITTITSHQQGLRQCRMYIKRKWPNVDLEEWEDTAAAAKDLAEGKLPKTTAVIASVRAAELYGLEIFEENIQDLKFNFTTFLAVERRAG